MLFKSKYPWIMLSQSLWAVVLLVLGCGSQGFSKEERRDFDALERAIHSISSAPSEDRTIRLKELEAVPVESERLKRIKTLCFQSHRAFQNAEVSLGRAKGQTQKIENMIIEARAQKKMGRELTREQLEEIKNTSEIATSSIGKVTEALNKAEKLVASCERERVNLRTLLMSEN
jgi:hypothetical protein